MVLRGSLVVCCVFVFGTADGKTNTAKSKIRAKVPQFQAILLTGCFCVLSLFAILTLCAAQDCSVCGNQLASVTVSSSGPRCMISYNNLNDTAGCISGFVGGVQVAACTCGNTSYTVKSVLASCEGVVCNNIGAKCPGSNNPCTNSNCHK